MVKRQPSVRRWSWDKTLSEPALVVSLSEQGYETERWSNEPGHQYGDHTHDFDKVILVIRGSITFSIPRIDEKYLLYAGDRLELPAGYAHSAEVGPQGVTCIEGQLPKKQRGEA